MKRQSVACVLLIIHALSIQLRATCHLHSLSYIVSYYGYYRADVRKEYIDESLQQIVVNIEKRPLLFSDFDVIEVPSCNSSSIVSLLSRSAHTRYVANNQRHSSKRIQSYPGYAGGPEIRHVPKLLNANKLWDMGFKGQGVRVAIFDTGLAKNHPHFHHIVERTDWTNEQTADDGLGHGTFVAGIIASADRKCDGLAPAANIYVYKVFTKKQVSFTSWFLDAFNHAILRRINILNLSIGGPDFTDRPFMDKVWELTANGIILISAIGNDGPRYGTLNNPADQMDVIGVGGINIDSKIARFSSRGMTTWELPAGYGRVKPDVVTYGASVYGSALSGGCRALSGTSVASPVVAGAVAVMLSGIEDKRLWNPAVVKQALIHGAQRLSNVATIFEQGAGKMNLLASFQFMRRYKPIITLLPPYMDYNECPYMWPYCSQPLYASALPSIINVTIVNGMGVSGRIVEEPTWEPFIEENGDLLNISIIHSDLIWPWSGYMAIAVSVIEDGRSYEGTASGRITVTVITQELGVQRKSTAQFLLRVKIIPTPPKSHRLLWDQYRNMRYPPGYIPKDDLRDKANILDWNADHPHTNFKALYQHLRSSNYHIEVLGEPLTCVDLSQYSAYLLVDPEEEFFPGEREKLFAEVEKGLNLIVFADWYNVTVMDKIKFKDENTKQWWKPETGGSNIPALNDLLSLWNITLSAHVSTLSIDKEHLVQVMAPDVSYNQHVLDGVVMLGNTPVRYMSGTSIATAPPDAWLAFGNLTDLGQELITEKESDESLEAAIFLYYKPVTLSKKSGFVSVFGDSTCLEVGTSGEMKGCAFLLEALLESTQEGELTVDLRSFMKQVPSAFLKKHTFGIPLPERLTTTNFANYSKVVWNFTSNAQPMYRSYMPCRDLPFSVPVPITNVTLSSDLNHDTNKGDQGPGDVEEISTGLTSVQLHELIQFFDAHAGMEHLEEVHPLQRFTAPFYGYTFWAFVFCFLFAMYYRIALRRLLLHIRLLRRMLRRLGIV